MSNSLWLHGLQHARLPCPSLFPRVCSNSYPLSSWCHPTISSSVTPSPALNLSQHQGLLHWISSSHQVTKVLEFQLHYQSFQRIFRTDFLEDWLVWYPCSPKDSQEYSPTTQFKNINSLVLSLLYGPTLTSMHDYWKNHSLTRWTFVSKTMSLLFNMVSSFVTAFLPKNKCLLVSWSQSPSAVILEPKKIKSFTVSIHCFPVYLPWSDGTECHHLSFLNVKF